MKKPRMVLLFSMIASLILVLGQINLGLASEAIVKRQATAWETGDVAGIVGDFAPDAVFIAGGFVFQGVEAIQKAAADYFKQFTDTKVVIKRTIFSDSQGAAEWNWSDRNIKSDRLSQAEDAIIYELREDGKIIYWREYIEKVDR